VAGSTFLFLEAEPVSVRFRAAAVESGWAAALACLAEVHSLAPEVDFREWADDFLALAADSLSLVDDCLAAVAGFHAPVADSREQADETLGPAVGSREQAAGSPERADVLAADFHGLAVDSLAQVAGFLAQADELEVELLVPAADFRAWAAACGWAAALADSAEVHSHAPEADFRELAAPSGSPEPARSRALAVDCRVPLVSQVVLRSAYSAALPAAFLLRAAVADWLALLRLCLPAALERASRSTQCETRSVWVSSGQQE
jgi:hypothetical protein